MTHTRATLAALLVLGAGCRQQPKPRSMPGMVMPPDSAGTATATLRQPVHLSPAQARAIGVTYAIVERGPLTRTVRTVGQVQPAEARVTDVTSKIDGFVDRLLVNATGVTVRRGEPLLTMYSPMLVSAQEELLTARRLLAALDSSDADARLRARDLVEASRRRLAYWDISTDQVRELERTGNVTKTMTLVAPVAGAVLEKAVVAGQAVAAGTKLYRLADLSTVWIEGDVFEQDLSLIHVGAPARVELAAYPGKAFDGHVSFISPVVDTLSRTGRVRIVLPNTARLFRPGMDGTLYFDAQLGSNLLSIPASAVVITGERNVAFIVGPEGALEPSEITIGPRAGDRIAVFAGLSEGDRVVASANFLVDAESRLGGGAGMSKMPGMGGDTGGARP